MAAIDAGIKNTHDRHICPWPHNARGEVIDPFMLIARNILCIEHRVITSTAQLCNPTGREQHQFYGYACRVNRDDNDFWKKQTTIRRRHLHAETLANGFDLLNTVSMAPQSPPDSVLSARRQRQWVIGPCSF